MTFNTEKGLLFVANENDRTKKLFVRVGQPGWRGNRLKVKCIRFVKKFSCLSTSAHVFSRKEHDCDRFYIISVERFVFINNV